jgi:acyl transferase domain-containing protein
MELNNKKIAVIGMACRFPGANNLDEFWKNLMEGKETIHRFSDEELSKFEYRFEEIKNDPGFIRARGILDNIDRFDAEFFGITPREAARTDPQHRIWLETAWEAFEDAGCDPVNHKERISVFAGGSSNTYLLNNILRDKNTLENYIRLRKTDSFQLYMGNDGSFIPTKTAYHFNLKGAAVNIQTTCSTSLVAVSEACQSLSSHKSDISLAGAISIMLPQETGYIYQKGSILSQDGYCRPFDVKACGTVFSNGVGAVILKRLDDAIRDHDRIYAVVTGWATNNDGNNRVSYTAPSIDGQSEVIELAQISADILPEDICYIEAHGTATQLGDPIELSALKNAFELKTDKKQFCGVGSVKGNIGHTDVAAGVASFIKTCLAAYYKRIPPTISYFKPNPYFDFENSPFFIQNEEKVWNEDKPLIMGVSSFGIGGTNAHVVVEEHVIEKKLENTISEWPALILLSAKSEKTLNRRRQDLIEFLHTKPGLDLDDVAFTLGTGRNHMPTRSFCIADNVNDIIGQRCTFSPGEADKLISGIAFMFPGQGSQYVSMGKDLYNSNRLFKEILDECFAIIQAETGEDIKELLYKSTDPEYAESKLSNTEITQPVLFIIEYALAKLFEQFDIKPRYLIGHSIGEYTAACIAGVFDLKTALKVVIKRGQLMQRMEAGNMMAVRTSVDKLKSLNDPIFEIAADNGPDYCTISFKTGNTEKIKILLDQNGIQYIPLKTSHAFHSESFDPILSEFGEFVNQFRLNVPRIPFISCLTGEFITNEQATSGTYWAKQLRNTVLFRRGISTISEQEDVIYLEVGPNTHLSSLVRQNKDIKNKKSVIPTLAKPDDFTDQHKIMSALGKIYVIGKEFNYSALYGESIPNKISLPTYPFERNRHWIEFELQEERVSEYTKPEDNIPGYQLKHLTKDRTTMIPSADSVYFEDTVLKNNDQGLQNFIRRLIPIFEDANPEAIKPEANFREIEGYSSLTAFLIMGLIREAYNVEFTGSELRKSNTIHDIFSIIKLK